MPSSLRIGMLVVVLVCPGVMAADSNVGLPRYPSISPDGSQIVFSWRGDLWRLPSTGGHAMRLTSHPFNDAVSAWSRDGKRIAFSSDRSGAYNLYIMSADGTEMRQITEIDRTLALSGFAANDDGTEILTFSASLGPEPYPSPRPYFVPTAGGDMTRLFDAYGHSPEVSPDGTRVLFNRGMMSWNRRNYRGPDNRDVWLYDRKAKRYRCLTHWEGNDGRAKWIDDGSFVYASTRQLNCVNLYRLTVGEDESKAVPLTRYSGLDVEEFDISADGRTLVFAMWDSLYTLDLSQPNGEPRRLVIRAEEDEQDAYALRSIDRMVSEAALSPDGKTMAYIAFGDVYVRATEARSPTRRVTDTPAREKEIVWSPDGAKLYFTSDRSGIEGIYVATVKLTREDVKKEVEALRTPATRPAEEATTRPTETHSTTQPPRPATSASTRPAEVRWHDAIAFDVQPLRVGERANSLPDPSPDGRSLAFRRDLGKLMILDLAEGSERLLVDGWSTALHWTWSPDSRYIAYATEDEDYNSDIWITRSDGKDRPINITQHPHDDYSPGFSADGKILAFVSERVNREYDVYMVYLDREMEILTAPELAQHYKNAAAAARKREPLKQVRPSTRPSAQVAEDRNTRDRDAFSDAYLRVRRVTSLPGSEGDLHLTPGGDRYVFVATVGADKGVYTVDKDFGAPKRLGSAVNIQHLSLSGDHVVFVEGGRAGTIRLADGVVEYQDISERIRVDLRGLAEQKFLEAARIVGERFWDSRLNGLDWRNHTRKYLTLAHEARTANEFDHVAGKFIGELNGSHLGIDTPDPANPQSQPVGRLAITYERTPGGFEVKSILPEGPAARGAMRLEAGDVITAIDLEPFAANQTLESRLVGKVGKETIVTVRRSMPRGAARPINLLLTPISYSQWNDLAYRNWRLETARKVEKWSDGRIGYIHIQGMNQSSLDVFERDLYAAAHGRKGLIIDVRNNGGGWTTDRLLASIMAPDHAYTVARGMPDGQRGYPHDRLFIARYTLPINMLCNERSFSNAEIISHAFKTLKRGTLVGQRTAGAVISTGGATLLDGTTVRIPFRGWYLPDGTAQEHNGATPDMLIEQTPEDEQRGHDAQLKAAVDDLVKRLK